MALPACAKCGKTDPRRMIGLMTLWFGPFVDLRPDYGYFHLCPSCYRTHVKPHMDQVQGRLADLHPLAHHLGLQTDGPDTDGDEAGRDQTESEPPAADASRRAIAGS